MDRRNVLAAAVGLTAMPSVAAAAVCETSKPGRFIGRMKLQRNYPYFELLDTYTYVDGCGKRWVAPIGAETDGASIPKVAQLFVGDPYSGPYLDAAIIHDWFCATRTEPYQDVHRMFYNAMLTSRVGPTLARIMYAAVCWRGPSWDELTVRNNRKLYQQSPSHYLKRPRLSHTSSTGLEAISLPPAPDASLLAKSRKALRSQDVSEAERYLEEYERQDDAYRAGQERLADEKKLSRAPSNLSATRLSEQEARDRALLQELITLTDTARSPDEVASIAVNFGKRVDPELNLM